VVRPRGTDNAQVRYIGALGTCSAVSGYSTAALKNLRLSGGLQSNSIKLF
jgi:hypothetical protein